MFLCVYLNCSAPLLEVEIEREVADHRNHLETGRGVGSGRTSMEGLD